MYYHITLIAQYHSTLSSFQKLAKRLKIVTIIHIYSLLCRSPVGMERQGREEKALGHYEEALNRISQFLKSLRCCDRKPTKHFRASSHS